ncbi:unnamed protein product [Litomosoides sigmodontis]|uniref:Tudor domain-containing protein n=1 Tax=Litomosoides sigmodontis TaxID=42156 RepID=A0A3P6TBH9_LITSI|nr:unnamed protein product [Litomosoides sigmodontis]
MNEGQLEELLMREGWSINGKQLSDFIDEPLSQIQDVNRLKKLLLDADMRDYALPMLSDRINKQLREFMGPLVVQLSKNRNISYPRYSEATHTDGLIKIQLSDGFSSVKALLFEPIPMLNTQTPPGTKLRLVGKIPMENGMLLINETNCQVLGGSVQKMVEKWNMEKNWLQRSIRVGENNAPKWIPFSKQNAQSSLPVNVADKTFRANDVINGVKGTKMVDEHGDDFSASRKARIEQIVENNAIKKFAQSQLKPKPLRNPTPNSCAINFNKENRRFVRDDMKNISPERLRRPSKAHTLYDFMQSKVTFPDGCPKQQHHGNLKVEQETNPKDIETQAMDRPQRNRFNEKGTIRVSKSNRYRKQLNCQPQHGKNVAGKVTTSDKFSWNYEHQSVSTTSNELSALHISSTDNESADCSKDHDIPQQTVFFGSRNRSHQRNAADEQMDEQQEEQQQQQQPFHNVMLDEKIQRVWKIGDKCLAPWSDGEFYTSTLVSMGPADMCTIEYDEYGNRSSVPVGVLLPFQGF